MRKFIKWLGAIVIVLVLAAVLAVVCVVTFINPNRFKPFIAAQVTKTTGRQLTMDGDLSWSLVPYLGVKTGHLLLSNPQGFESNKPFAEIQHATVGLNLFSLMHKKLESSGITLDGLKLNLIRKENGKTNWQFQQSQPTAVAATVTTANGSIPKRSLGLAISGIAVSNAEINWIDEQKKQSISVEKLGLRAKNIKFLNPFPIECEFDFTSKNPLVSGHIGLTSNTSLSIDQQVFSFRDLMVTAQVKQGGKTFDGKVKGDVIADLQQQTLQWTHFQGQMGNMNVLGKIGVTDLITSPHATGHFQVQPFDAKALLKSMGEDLPAVQVLKNMSGDIDFAAASNAVDVRGQFKIDTVEANRVKLNHVVVPVRYQIGVLELSSITADVYQGSLESNAKVNLTGTGPQMAVQAKLLNVHAEPLLQDLGGARQKLKFTGVGNVELQVTTEGNRPDVIIRNLNGTGHVSVTQGSLQGMDIGYLIDSAYAFATRKTITTVNTSQTDFGNLTANIVFRDGVMVNDDLLLNSPRFKTKGQGRIDLANQKIDFHLQTIVNKSAADQKNDWGNLYGLPIPILVTGNLADPSIRLDTAALAKTVAVQQIKKIETKVQDQIKDKIQGNAGRMLENLLGH